MKPGEMTKPMREALGAFALCAALGFPDDAVFLHPTRAVGDEKWVHMFVMVRYEGKTFRLDCGRMIKVKATGPLGASADAAIRQMCELAMTTWNATPVDEREAFVHKTGMWSARLTIALQMQSKGITPPALRDGWNPEEGTSP